MITESIVPTPSTMALDSLLCMTTKQSTLDLISEFLLEGMERRRERETDRQTDREIEIEVLSIT